MTGLLARFDFFLAARPTIVYAALVVLYACEHLPKALVAHYFYRVSVPLFSFYVAGIHSGGISGPTNELARIAVSPTDLYWINPPGLWWISEWTGSVGAVHALLFLAQWPVPGMVYSLARRWASPTTAVAAAVLSIKFCVDVQWFSQDWLIQPLLLSAIALLWAPGGGPSWRRAAGAGLLIGAISVLKQNIGLFAWVAASSYILLLHVGRRPAGSGRSGRALLLGALGGYAAFAAVFWGRMPFTDGRVYYLLPYGAVWGGVFAWFLREKLLEVDQRRFWPVWGALTAANAAFALPAFLWVGASGGFGRTFHAWFGMGFEFLHLWNFSISHLVAEHFIVVFPASAGAVMADYYWGLLSTSFLLPPAVGCLLAAEFARGLGTRLDEEQRRIGAFAAFAATFQFALFPLEASHILQSKLAVFVLALAGAGVLRGVARPSLKALSVFLAIPAAMAIVLSPTNMVQGVAASSSAVRRVVGLPMEPSLARELSLAESTLRAATAGGRYIIVDFSGAGLAALLALVPNGQPQWQIYQRPGIVRGEALEQLSGALASAEYAVVNSMEWRGAGESDHAKTRLLGEIRRDFTALAAYEPPSPPGPFLNGLPGFIVLRRQAAPSGPKPAARSFSRADAQP